MNANHSSRRTLLKRSAQFSAAVLSSPPLFLHAQDKSGTRETIIGQGEHQYRCIHHWGRDSLPSSHHYGNASHGVTIDREGYVYISHTGSPDSVFVFDPNGKYVRSLGSIHAASKNNQAGGATISSGHGIDLRDEDGTEYIYLSAANTNMSFAKLTLQGEVVWQRSRKELFEFANLDPSQTKFRPTNISFRPDGGYYLGDGYGSFRLYQFNAEDEYLGVVGRPGDQDGEFKTPHGHWLDDRDGTPKLVVADRANHRLQWFGMDGKHLRTQGGFMRPADIDVFGDLMLVPDLDCRITLLDAKQNVIAHLGEDQAWLTEVQSAKGKMRAQPQKWRDGRFIHPHDACFDAQGDIYVTEWVKGGRVTKLERV